MASKAPLWRRVFDTGERAVGSRLESLVQTGEFAALVGLGTHLRAEVIRRVERQSSRLWHLANLPAGSDIRRLREQLVRVDRRLVAMAKELEELKDESGRG